MKKIIVPVDFSEVSEYAAQFATELAKRSGASVLLINSVRESQLAPSILETEALTNELSAYAYDRIRRMQKEVASGDAKVEIKVSRGGLIEALEEEVKEGADLCVMGTTGSSGWDEVLIGSNTEKVVRNLKCPVISVPGSAYHEEIKKILVPVDLMELRPSFLAEVKQLQKFFGAQLAFLWVKTPHDIENKELLKAQFDGVMGQFGIEDYTLEILHDILPSDGILYKLQRTSADMVAMATHARRGIMHWFAGSLTEDTVNHVDVPVWTFKIDGHEEIIRLKEIEKVRKLLEASQHSELLSL